MHLQPTSATVCKSYYIVIISCESKHVVLRYMLSYTLTHAEHRDFTLVTVDSWKEYPRAVYVSSANTMNFGPQIM